jgi:hypothetical protein
MVRPAGGRQGIIHHLLQPDFRAGWMHRTPRLHDSSVCGNLKPALVWLSGCAL